MLVVVVGVAWMPMWLMAIDGQTGMMTTSKTSEVVTISKVVIGILISIMHYYLNAL